MHCHCHLLFVGFLSLQRNTEFKSQLGIATVALFFFFLFKLLPLPWAPATLLLAGWSWASPGGDGGTETSLEEEPSRAPTQCPVSQQESLSTALLPPEIPGRGLDKGHDRWRRLSLPSAGKKNPTKNLASILGCVTHRGKKKREKQAILSFSDFMLCEQLNVYSEKKDRKSGVFFNSHQRQQQGLKTPAAERLETRWHTSSSSLDGLIQWFLVSRCCYRPGSRVGPPL